MELSIFSINRIFIDLKKYLRLQVYIIILTSYLRVISKEMICKATCKTILSISYIVLK